MEREAVGLMGKPGYEDFILRSESDTAAYGGQFAKAREAVRNPECAGVLLAAIGDARPCGGGAVPEAGESAVGADPGQACRPFCKHWRTGVRCSLRNGSVGRRGELWHRS